MTGFVYLATNDAMPGLVKIGMTAGDVQKRMSELSSATGVADEFVCKCFCAVKNAKHVEKQLHELFADYKHKKEFFNMDWLSAAVALLALAVAERNDNNKNQIPNSDTSLSVNSSPPSNPAAIPEPVEGRQQRYLKYVVNHVANKSTAKQYVKHLKHLSENHLNGRSVYDINSLVEAEEIKTRLSAGGDLYVPNLAYKKQAMGAAMRKYVEFLEQGGQ